MSDKTLIQWCDATFNPWIGCTKVGPGCVFCYAEESTPSRVFGVEWGKGQERRRTSEANWELPRRWNRAAIAHEGLRRSDEAPLQRRRVFCASLADWLDDEVPIEWLADLLKLIHETPNLDWLLLTKRPENWEPRLNQVAKLWACDGGYRETAEARAYHDLLCAWRFGRPPANVWFGVSVEDQQRAKERIPALLKIPARVRFLSVEPLLGPIDMHEVWPMWTGADGTNSWDTSKLHWVIVGGESGPKARACNVEWVRSVVQQCKAAGVPCFVKQLGSNVRVPAIHDAGGTQDWRRALVHTKGGDPSEWPEDLRVREMPVVRRSDEAPLQAQ